MIYILLAWCGGRQQRCRALRDRGLRQLQLDLGGNDRRPACLSKVSVIAQVVEAGPSASTHLNFCPQSLSGRASP
jgi:hypothetical protein